VEVKLIEGFAWESRIWTIILPIPTSNLHILIFLKASESNAQNLHLLLKTFSTLSAKTSIYPWNLLPSEIFHYWNILN
jgi:hypothetical protein